jgi:DNA modification methylase
MEMSLYLSRTKAIYLSAKGQGKLFDDRRWFDESFKGYQFQQMLIWHAPNHCEHKSRKWFKQSWEPIFLYRRVGSQKDIITGDRAWTTDMHNFDCSIVPAPEIRYTGTELKQHPCQKPVPVMRWIVHALSEPGDLVAAPFCGSAPCGIAAAQLGRHYHGIEIDAKCRRIAEARIAAYGK